MIHWNISPEILSLGPLTLRWYGLLFAIAFILGHRLIGRYFARDGLSWQQVDQLLIYMVIGTVVGARLGHVFFYEPAVYLAQPWRIFAVWEGGLASHGASIGILLSVYLYSRRNRQLSYLAYLDRVSVTIALGAFLVRLGNFFNSEIIGKPTHADWGVIFERVDFQPRHPTQLYESFFYLMVFILIYRLSERASVRKQTGLVFGIFLTLVFIGRFLIEFLKENQVAFESSLPLNMGQLLSIPLVLAGIVLIVRARRLRS